MFLMSSIESVGQSCIYSGIADSVATVSRTALNSSIERSFVEGGDPAEVAELVVRVAGAKAPRLRYRVGSDARWVPVLKGLLPQKAFAIGMRKRFNVRKAT